ncbi:MAG TPA: lipopolysaccharide heptosyltransferase I [Phycisphaerae bacterium]|nr:lipopolysaccharide heptosyltransferase I [Phycisphaerae bacterium]
MAFSKPDRAADAIARPKRILIIKPSSLGDIVHALPVLAALRRANPGAHIAWLASRSFAALLDGHPLLDEVIVFDRARYGKMLRSGRALGEFLRFLRELRRRRFDLVVDLQGLFRSGFLAFASGAEQRVGFAAARESAGLFYTQRVRCPPDARHAVDKNLCVVAALGLRTDRPEFPLGLRLEEIRAAKTLLTTAAGRPLKTFTAVIPGARWESKRWRPERIAALIDRMHEESLPSCVLLGSAADRPFADRVVAACHSPAIDLVGRTSLRELAALLGLSDRVICHDSGPMHIAAALDKPLVAIFGPTDPEVTGPYRCPKEGAFGTRPTFRVVATPIECSPCRLRTCDHHSCMEQLAVETVLAQVREIGAGVFGRRAADGPRIGTGVPEVAAAPVRPGATAPWR